MASDSVVIHRRRETGTEDELSIIHAQNRPLSMNRLRQFKDEVGLARQRRQRKKLEEQKVRIRHYREPLGDASLDIATWKGGGSDVRQDIIVPLRQRYAQFMGRDRRDWSPSQIIQPQQAEALPSETKVISDAGAGLEANFMPGPYGSAPVGGYKGIPMQRGVELPEQEVTVGCPLPGLSELTRLPTTDPEYDLDLVMQTGGTEPNGGYGMQMHVKTKKAGRLFYTLSWNFKDGTHICVKSEVVQVPADTQTPITVHISGSTMQSLQSRAGGGLAGFAMTFYAAQGIVGLRKKMIAQATQGDI